MTKTSDLATKTVDNNGDDNMDQRGEDHEEMEHFCLEDNTATNCDHKDKNANNYGEDNTDQRGEDNKAFENSGLEDNTATNCDHEDENANNYGDDNTARLGENNEAFENSGLEDNTATNCDQEDKNANDYVEDNTDQRGEDNKAFENSGLEDNNVTDCDHDDKNTNNYGEDNTAKRGEDNEAFENFGLEDNNATTRGQEDKTTDTFGQENTNQYSDESGTVENNAQENIICTTKFGQYNDTQSKGIGGPHSPVLETPEEYSSRWRSIRVMYYTMFATNVSLTIIFSSVYPFLQILDKTVSTDFLGGVVAAYSIGQLIAAPIFGAWSNLRGRAREPLVVSLIIDIPANVLYMYLESIHTDSKIFMIVSRALVGFGSGNIAVVRSYVSGATTLAERTSVMANMSAFQTIGFVMGPLIQAAMVPIGYPGFVHADALSLNMYTLPGLLCALLDVVNLALLIFVFREHRISDDMETQDEGIQAPDDVGDNDDKPLDYVAVISTLVLFFSVMFSFIILETICTPLSMHMFSWTKAQATLYVGIMLGVGGMVSIVVFIAIKFLSKRFNERCILLSGFVIFLVGYFTLLPWGQNYPDIQMLENTTSSQAGVESVGCPDVYQWCFDTPAIILGQFILGSVLIAVGYPTCYVMCFTIYSKILGPKPQGVWMGWVTAAGSLARTLGPIFVSMVYDAAGPRVTFSATVGFLFLTIVGLVLVFRRLVPFAMRKHPRLTV